MDTEAAFEHIKDNIKDEKYDMVLPEVKEIVSQCGGDVQILFKCASLLKVVEEEDYCQEILDSITEMTTVKISASRICTVRPRSPHAESGLCRPRRRRFPQWG